MGPVSDFKIFSHIYTTGSYGMFKYSYGIILVTCGILKQRRGVRRHKCRRCTSTGTYGIVDFNCVIIFSDCGIIKLLFFSGNFETS